MQHHPNQGNQPHPYQQQQQQQQPVQQQQQQQPWLHAQQQPSAIPPSSTTTIPPPPPPSSNTPPLPPGWITATDPISGRVYYANTSTGQTSWDPPKVIPPPPPGLPLPPPPPPRTNANNVIINQHLPTGVPIDVGIIMSHSNPIPAAVTAAAATTTIPTTFPIHNNTITPDISQIIQFPSTINTKGLLINSARTTIQRSIADKANKQLANTTTTNSNDKTNTNTTTSKHQEQSQELEFEQLSAGTIADLAHVQSEYYSSIDTTNGTNDTGGSGVVDMANNPRRYEPLRPFEMPLTLKVPHIEPGRVEIRLMGLLESLRKI